MAVIPYQPTYSVQPKYGFRYLSQPPVPNVTTPKEPPKVGLDGSRAAAPAVMGAQEGQSYLDDPFDDAQFGGVQDSTRRSVAGELGYQQAGSSLAGGLGTIVGMAAGIPLLGTVAGAVGDKLKSASEPAYGSFGTYDASGNVFANEGQAYDPITGMAVAQYASPQDAFNTVVGGYGKLRDGGYGIGESALGSYQNSVLNTSFLDRQEGYSPAAKAGLWDVSSQIRSNTMSARGLDDPNLLDGEVGGGFDITAESLGFTPDMPGYDLAKNNSGIFGTNPGDIGITDSGQKGVINDLGQLVTASGTVVQGDIRDANNEVIGTWSGLGDGGGFQPNIDNTLYGGYDTGGDEDYVGGFDWSSGSDDNSGWGNDSGGEFSTSTSTSDSFGAGRTDDDDWDDNEGGSWQDWDNSSSNDDSGGGDSGGGCFLTTAIVERRGEADDGKTLTKLRSFRDTFMGGKESDELKEYYTIAPLIVEAIPNDHSDWDWIEKQIDLAIVEIDNNQHHNAYNIYKSMVLRLKEEWL